MSLGYSKANSSGIAGNIFVESSYNPLAVGDNGTSLDDTMAQNEMARLNAWAKKTTKTQILFKVSLIIWLGIKNTEKAYQKLIEAKTLSVSL